MADYSYQFKFIIIGNSNVGKSSLNLYFTEGKFFLNLDNTVGVEFGSRFLKVKDKKIKLQIWDTAGQEQFRSVTRSYYRNSICALIVYDVTEQSTFDDVVRWIDETTSYAHDQMVKILVGNKKDLESKRVVKYETAKALADKHNMFFYETSAKTGENVEAVFTTGCSEVLSLINRNVIDVNNESKGVKIGLQAFQVNQTGPKPAPGGGGGGKPPKSGCC